MDGLFRKEQLKFVQDLLASFDSIAKELKEIRIELEQIKSKIK